MSAAASIIFEETILSGAVRLFIKIIILPHDLKFCLGALQIFTIVAYCLQDCLKNNPCCDGSICKLRRNNGAECSTERCCSNCKV